MKFLFGLVMVMACVLGGYLAAGGALLALWQPFELVIILGGSIGAFIIANTPKVIKESVSGILGLFKGAKYKKQVYIDLLGLMYALFSKSRKEGLMALENDIEEPDQSEIFKTYPKLAANHHLIDFICDYLRLMVGGNMNAFELENLMDIELDTHHAESHKASAAITGMGDGLPAFGIVAAVMGVVITMGYINEPPDVLGHHVGAALVGTFLGILMAYGFVSPMGSAMEARAEEDTKLFEVAKVCIMATLNGYTPQIAVEFGRKALYSDMRPGFIELEEFVKGS
ncbi:Flagellar motor rotation protein MotA [hydrothermal vent metagenome]|uniref:Flagellar motor rotation protein MotA n=1 Tax=hydrothermal vent metagenome TaxID=652676 RepID=A0A3B0ZZW4_9ZZZZ